MKYWTLLGACISTYVLLNFLIIPDLRARWLATRAVGKISKAGVLVALDTLKVTSFVVSLAYLVFAAVIVGLRVFGGNVQVLTWTIDAAIAGHEVLSSTKKLLETWTFVVPVAALVVFAWRHRKNEMARRFADEVLDELDRLNRERAANPSPWGALDASEEMQSLDADLNSLREALATGTPVSDRQARVRLAKQIALLEERRRVLDYERRIDFERVHAAVAGPDPAPESGWRGYRAFLLTKGFLQDTRTLAKLLSRASVAALSISMISLSAHAGLDNLLAERVVTLDDLRVSRTKPAEARPLDTVEPPALTESDHVAARHLVTQFSRSFVANRQWRTFRPDVSVPRQVEQDVIRRAILQRSVLPTATGQASGAVEHTTPLTAVERQIIDDLPPSARRAGPDLAEVLARERPREVVSWFGGRWERVKRATLAHAALYRQPADAADLQSALVDRIVTSIVDESVPLPENELGRQARGVFTNATKSAIKEGVDLGLRQFLSDLASGTSIDDALRGVRQARIPVPLAHAEAVSILLREAQAAGETLRSKVATDQLTWRAPSAVEQSVDAPPTSSAAGDPLESVIREATEAGKHSLSADTVEALAEYEDHFPRSTHSQERTVLGRTMARHTLPRDQPALRHAALTRVTRARSFGLLRGFSRVGGVLIGAEPENPRATLDLADLEWQVTPQQVTLRALRSSGERVELGTHDRALVHQALAYAADGRPVAVTMTTAAPLRHLKIHLHPALVDTPLGCAMTQLDRLVDTYAGGDVLPQRDEAVRRYQQQRLLYALAWSSRLATLSDEAPDVPAVQQAGRLASRLQGDADVRSALARFGALDGGASIYRSRPEYFDSTVVDAMRGCSGHREPSGFGRCVAARFAGTLSPSNEAQVARWFRGPAAFESWSGVRERPYAVGRDLGFIREDRTSDGGLRPFRFMVQIAFASAPVAGGSDDTEPLELTDLEAGIQDLVRQGVSRDRLEGMIADLRRFTSLQRLFRVLLNGQGGNRFPVRRLAALATDTAGTVRYVHTRRWNGSDTSQFRLLLSLVVQARTQGSGWQAQGQAMAARCLAAARADWSNAANACDFSSIRSAALSSCASGGANSDCQMAQLAVLAPDIQTTAAFEKRFGVLEDEARDARSSCDSVIPPASRHGGR